MTRWEARNLTFSNLGMLPSPRSGKGFSGSQGSSLKNYFKHPGGFPGILAGVKHPNDRGPITRKDGAAEEIHGIYWKNRQKIERSWNQVLQRKQSHWNPEKHTCFFFMLLHFFGDPNNAALPPPLWWCIS